MLYFSTFPFGVREIIREFDDARDHKTGKAILAVGDQVLGSEADAELDANTGLNLLLGELRVDPPDRMGRYPDSLSGGPLLFPGMCYIPFPIAVPAE